MFRVHTKCNQSIQCKLLLWPSTWVTQNCIKVIFVLHMTAVFHWPWSRNLLASFIQYLVLSYYAPMTVLNFTHLQLFPLAKTKRSTSEIVEIKVAGKFMMFWYRSIYLVMKDLLNNVSKSRPCVIFSPEWYQHILFLLGYHKMILGKKHQVNAGYSNLPRSLWKNTIITLEQNLSKKDRDLQNSKWNKFLLQRTDISN